MTLHLHLPEGSDLKAKRKQVKSLSAQLRQRFGASVAEVDHHDLWQRSTLVVAMVGRERAPLLELADSVQRFAESRFEDQVRTDRVFLSAGELRED